MTPAAPRSDTVQPVLHIGAHQTVFWAGSGAAAQTLSLAMGFSRTATECFGHSPPSAGELEAAIMVVEDELSRVPVIAAPQATVRAPAAVIEALGRSAGLADGAASVLSLNQVERLFNLLAALSMGRPAASAGIPADLQFAATLLILRESMHHLKFDAVHLEAVARA
ncbi:hypothetical protein [Rhodoferax sp.]|uniref:hypothetical protein n=1 Tax=Rhodoferax sp. TaxID=50421 RepID=UPI0025E33A04|nr:hypothetical protein [Rhodoferax sp.]MCM2296460.1 hypothetical protein [Rhodoferax sp.]